MRRMCVDEGWRRRFRLKHRLTRYVRKYVAVLSMEFKAAIVCCPVSRWIAHMSRLMTKPTKWHVRQTKTQISHWASAQSDQSIRCAHEESLGPLSAQRRLWSGSDLSLRWAHMPFRWFCHEAAHMLHVSIRHIRCICHDVSVIFSKSEMLLQVKVK